MADSEQVQRESPSQQTADYSVRYGTRTLLIAMAVVAVLCAIFAPFVRELRVSSQVGLALLWGTAFVTGIPLAIQAFRARRQFLNEQQDAILLPTITFGGSKRRQIWAVLTLIGIPIIYSHFAVAMYRDGG